jgi:Superinfection immunity protein
VGAVIVIIFIAGLYFTPMLVALIRGVPNQGSVFVVNFFLGWTFVGWVVALAMAARSPSAGTEIHVAQHVVAKPPDDDPGLNAAVAKAIADYEGQRTALPESNPEQS